MPLVAELTVRVELAVPPLVNETLDGLRDAVKPEVETVVERETVPVKLYRLVSVIVAVLEELRWTVRLVGLEEMLKLGGLNGLSLANLMATGEEVPRA